MDFNCRKIEASDRADDFDCGDAPLNEYLRKYARQDQRRSFGVTYVAVSSHHSPNRVIGYFTLANTSIPREGLPEALTKGIPRYQNVPAFLLGRLAIDKHYQGKKIGEHLLSRCMKHCLELSRWSGARLLVADALESAVSWYERYNFVRVMGGHDPHRIKMVVDLDVARSAIIDDGAKDNQGN